MSSDTNTAADIAVLKVRIDHIEEELKKVLEGNIVDSVARTQLKDFSDWRTEYLLRDREATCIGKEQLDNYKKEVKKDIEDDVLVKVAKINARGASWKEIAVLVCGIATLVGQIYSTQQNAKLQLQIAAMQQKEATINGTQVEKNR